MRPHGKTKLGFFPLPIAEVTRLQKNWQDNSAFASLPAVGQDEARRIGEDGDLMDRYIIAGREGVVKATLATKFLPSTPIARTLSRLT